jgi:hypothetical protein
VAFLDEDEPLPFMHTVWRAKIVWAVVFDGVVGEANLVGALNRIEGAPAPLSSPGAALPGPTPLPRQSFALVQHIPSPLASWAHASALAPLPPLHLQVIKYNTSFTDAVAGRVPKNGELSLRIRREVAGPESERRMAKALKAVAAACQVGSDAGGGCMNAARRLGNGALRLCSLPRPSQQAPQ